MSIRIYDGKNGLEGDGNEIQVIGPNGSHVKAIQFELNNTKRDEVVEQGNKKYFKNGQEFWVSYWFYLPEDPTTFDKFGTLGHQLHTAESAKESPIAVIRWSNGKLKIEVNGADDIELDGLQSGVWYQAIWRYVASTKNGEVELWLRDQVGNEDHYLLLSPGGNLSAKSLKGDSSANGKWGLYASKLSTASIILYRIMVTEGEEDSYELHSGESQPPNDDDDPVDDPIDPIDPVDVDAVISTERERIWKAIEELNAESIAPLKGIIFS